MNSTAESINTVVFDFGGVLVDWNPRYMYRKIFTDEAKMESFLRDICTSEWNEKQDAGRTLREATELLIRAHPEFKNEITAYYERWPEMLAGAIEGTVEILRELKQQGRVRLLGLTNWSGETFPIALKRFDFFQHLDGILVSGDEKLLKPDPKFYSLLMSRYGVDPKQTVFIDDMERNTKAAAAMGFQTIRFTNSDDLRRRLQSLGVLKS